MISTLDEVSKQVKQQKKLGKKVGLITGCFDVLHFGHIQFLRSAKKRVDYLIVGLDNDQSIYLSKGKNHPLNSIRHRLEILSELRSVDAVFEITKIFDFRHKPKAAPILRQITKYIKPHCLITNINTDNYWKEKKDRAKYLQIQFLPLKIKRPTSSTKIIHKLTK